ncbi:MAG TPA: hypothetical protein ENI52_00225 [Thermoplasmata archaeon]|nr:hypothetical protein [Thermoplasmata archaeon]
MPKKYVNLDVGRPHNMVEIVVAVFDLEGFTKFFNSVDGENRIIIVNEFMRDFIKWFENRMTEENDYPPNFSKFLGDGFLIIWETQTPPNESTENIVDRCWEIVLGELGYKEYFLPEFLKKHPNWKYDYPPGLRVGVAWGASIKYEKEYLSNAINIASRLANIHPQLYFLATTNTYRKKIIDRERWHVQKIPLKGIASSVEIFADKRNVINIFNRCEIVI